MFRTVNLKTLQAVITTVILLLVLLMVVVLNTNIKQQLKSTLANISRIATTSLAQRQADTYADLGFAYITKVTQHYPKPENFPDVRYKDSNRHMELFLPDYVSRIDKKVLVAIDVPETAFSEQTINTLTQVNTSDWTFKTKDDYDALTGFSFTIISCPQPQLNMHVAVYMTASASTARATLNFSKPCISGKTYVAHLNKAISGFSFNRGDTPFLVKVSGGDIDPANFAALGIKIDVDGYTQINHENANYTFVHNDLLNNSEFTPYLEYLRHV